MTDNDLDELLSELLTNPKENETLELKENFHDEEELAKNISALANSACLHDQEYSYIIYGVHDKTHETLGTDFDPETQQARQKKITVEAWLMNMLSPRPHIITYIHQFNNKRIVVYRIPAASREPTRYNKEAYVRIGSTTRMLADFPEKEALIWSHSQKRNYFNMHAIERVELDKLSYYINFDIYFDLLGIPIPQTIDGKVDKFIKEGFLTRASRDKYAITQLGALLFAKTLDDFTSISRKGLRIIKYKGNNKIETEREKRAERGYALEIPILFDWIYAQLPSSEEIGIARRKESTMYPSLAIREIVLNSLIHQDFYITGSPTVEIYSDRIEISNPGIPCINIKRFIDEYSSRNEELADIMRRLGYCEEKGSGLDKTILYNELYQLPAINISIQSNRTIVILYSFKPLSEMEKEDKIRACYQHACLKYVSNEKMTNESLRERLGIEKGNAAIASRILADTLKEGLIKAQNPDSATKKFKKYIPFWA